MAVAAAVWQVHACRCASSLDEAGSGLGVAAAAPAQPGAPGSPPHPDRPQAGPRPGPDAPDSTATTAGEAGNPTPDEAVRLYPWARRAKGYEPIPRRIPPPRGFYRVEVPRGSWAHWLRHLPLLPAGTPVRSYRGDLILEAGDPRLAAVVDLDLSDRDRQQCADTLMRLRGEYWSAMGKPDRISLLWAGGKRFGYEQWRRGIRPVKQGKRWEFKAQARPRTGYRSVRAYLEFMFSWTGTLNLMGEAAVARDDLQAGDFFIRGGSPGHTVILVDLARDPSGKLRGLIGQGFMPAQDMHLLRGADGSPWFPLDPGADGVATPFWHAFGWGDLRRFSR